MGVIVAKGNTSIVRAESLSTRKVFLGEQALGGFSFVLDQYYDSIEEAKETSKKDTTDLILKKTSIPSDVAIANVNEQLNIRKEPSTEAELVGYLPANASCSMLEDVGEGWVKIKSGQVVGFTKSEYLYTGEEGKEKAEQLATLKATVAGNGVNLRSTPNTTAEDNIVTKLQSGEKLKVLDETVINKEDENAEIWVKLAYEGEEAYVSRDLLELSYEWKEAEPVVIEEPEVPASQPESTAVKQEEEVAETKTQEAPASSSSSASGTRSNIIKAAEDALGMPYVWAGNSLTTGADCSGYVLAAYRAAGVDTEGFSRASYAIAVSSKGRVISRSELKIGDMVFYGKQGKINHVAMYYGNGKIIHESSFDKKAVISSLDYSTPMAYRNFLGD